METDTYTKQIGGITYIISSVACSKETEKEVADKLKNIIIDAIKNTEKAIAKGDKTTAEVNLKNTIKYLDNAKVKGLIHQNKVNREKSRLTKKVNAMEVK